MNTCVNPFFGRITVSRARSFLAYQFDMSSSFVARLLALHPEKRISKGVVDVV